MGAIRLLSDQLINRIAAGEVIERPAAVLKELIENGLDAGAGRIDIEAQAGGRRSIVVADNGCGLAPDDLLLAVERHATSKIAEETDLLQIGTLGFRGEALASMAAVSRLTITSSAADDGRGRLIRLAAGKVIAVEEAARNRGTTVEVRDLFFNVPARRKFLKSNTTEAAHLLETVQRYALAGSDLRLTYKYDGQPLVTTSPQEDARTRLSRIMGRETARNMFFFQDCAGPYELSGFLGGPETGQPRAGRLYLFINSRAVRDRLLTRAVLAAYQSRLPRGRYPAAVIFIRTDPELVDVNVHPAKAEVRFRQPNEVFAATEKIIGRALSEHMKPLQVPVPAPRPGLKRDVPPAAAVAETLFWEITPPEARPGEFGPPLAAGPPDAMPLEADSAPEAAARPEGDGVPDESVDPGAWRPVGQLFRSYILAQAPDGLYVIDQHAAHERIIFEKMQTELQNGRLAGQGLLLPETLELTPTEAARLEQLTGELDRFGFELEPFGGSTFVLRAVPAVLTGQDPVRAVREIIAAAKEYNPRQGLERLEKSLLESLSCQAAVKAGQEMTWAEMDRLLIDLSATSVSTNCPHGRPLVFCLKRREIEKRFQRA